MIHSTNTKVVIEMPHQDEILCEQCDQPASKRLFNELEQKEHLFCNTHVQQIEWAGANSDWSLKDWRFTNPENAFSLHLKALQDPARYSEEIRYLQMAGGDAECDAYLSLLTNTDQFVLWGATQVETARRLVATNASESGSRICTSEYHVSLLRDYFRLLYHRQFQSPQNYPPLKQELALECLLKHPDWTNPQIAAAVPTTLKQLQRFSDFNAVRICMARILQNS